MKYWKQRKYVEIKKMAKIKSNEITVSGKRKTAIAKATIKQGSGIVKINNKSLSSMDFLKRLAIEEPLKIAESLGLEKNYDIKVNVKGGGSESQIQASRLAIARALLAFSKKPELRRALIQYDRTLLVADVRRKEAYKPGDSKARAKRQKSYR